MSTDSNGASGKQVHSLPLVKTGGAHDNPGPEEIDHPHGHLDASGDHVPHVLPLWIYLATWGALLVLTGITVGASYVNVGSWNILIALGIATCKATVVAMMFMHLKWDHKFHAIVFSFSLIFLAIFIAFTMYDTETRGRADMRQADRPVDVHNPFAGGGKKDAALKAAHPQDVPAPSEPPR